METAIFDISFEHDGKKYSGWVNPSDKTNAKGLPVSFHVVLDDVSFGNVSFNGTHWAVDEQRPQALVSVVGKSIEEGYRK
jgi:hypothetical protein